ncbi:putative monooxygenase [Thozetella sp. PMI_491]|nr:putative monooxygenase [Thozetella sp. PMI_491]
MSLTGGVTRATLSGISVLIVGAGPVGVFTALECWRKGHSTRIVERHSASVTQGDFFTIAPQVIKQIQTWPEMVEENERIAPDPWVSYHKSNGELLTGPEPFDWASQLKSTSTDETQGYPTRIYRHNRPKFLNMLVSQLRRVGIDVEYEHRVVEYYEDEDKAGVILDSGEKLEADIVVAADGIGTKSHKLVNGHDIRAWSSGLASFRSAFSAGVVTSDPELNSHFRVLDNGHPHIQMWHGQGCQVMFFRTEDTMCWLLMHKDDGTSTEFWHATVEPEAALQHLAKVAPDFPEYAKKLIKSTPTGALFDWKIMWRDPQEVTVSPRGRVVQVGDAAHTFLPSSGNGANQGIEDGIVLANCLQLGGKENISWSTRVHSKLRFERVSSCQKLGFINHQKRTNPNIKAIEKDPKKLKSEVGQWLWRHNPEEYTHQNFTNALDHVKNGAPFQNTNIPAGYVYKPWKVNELMAEIEAGKEVQFEGDWS